MPSRRDNKVIRTGIILGALVLSRADAARAAPYIGLDADRVSITLKQSASEFFPQSASGFDLHLGDRFGDFAGEIGYGTNTYYGNSATDNLHLTRWTADGYFYLPVFDRFDLLVTAGGVETNYGVSTYARNAYLADDQNKISNADVPVLQGNEFDWRTGAGFSFGLDEFELRVLARYQPLSLQDQAQNALSLELGVNMSF